MFELPSTSKFGEKENLFIGICIRNMKISAPFFV